MTVNDLYFTKTNFSTNNRAWSFGLWLRESVVISAADDGTIVSNALAAHIQTQLLPVLTDSSELESVQAWRRMPGPSRPGYTQISGGVGTQTSDATPNDNALFINLRQEEQDAKYNGGIYLAGQGDGNMGGNAFLAGYLTPTVSNFTARLSLPVVAVSPASGEWEIVVLSKTFVPPTTPIGSPFLVTSAVATDRVMSQRRRQQKSRGWAQAGT